MAGESFLQEVGTYPRAIVGKLDIPLTSADPFKEEGASIIRKRRSSIRVLQEVADRGREHLLLEAVSEETQLILPSGRGDDGILESAKGRNQVGEGGKQEREKISFNRGVHDAMKKHNTVLIIWKKNPQCTN